jgi:type I restriction enzyme, S subunit
LEKIKVKFQKKSEQKRANSKPFKLPFDLPHNWQAIQLSDISLDVHYGLTTSANFGNEQFKFLRITDIQDNSVNWPSVPGCDVSVETAEKYRLDNGDIVIARTGGTVGKSYLVQGLTQKDFAVFASYLIRVIPSREIDGRYLKNVLESPIYWIQLTGSTTGTGQPNVNATSLKGFVFPLPPLAEQKRIVAKVDELMALCDRYEAAKATRDTLRQNLRKSAIDALMNASDDRALKDAWSIVQENWVDLSQEPEDIEDFRKIFLQLAVRGKLRTHNNEHLMIGSNAKWNIPSTWKRQKISEFSKSIQTGPFGTMLHQHDYISGGTPVVNPENMKPEGIVPKMDKTISDEMLAQLANYKLQLGDLVIARRGDIGRCAVITPVEQGWLCGTGSMFLRLNDDIFPEFIAMLLRSPYGRNSLGASSVGSTMANLNQKALKNLDCFIPPLPEQKRIVAKVEQLMTLCDTLETHLRDTQAKAKALAGAVSGLVVS